MSELGMLPALLLSASVVALSAFFVAVEFSLVAARRHRLEQEAETRLSARGALGLSRELTLLLAGAQLGITACLIALGALAKPALKHLLAPLIELTGAPPVVIDATSFILALVVVTFVHLVVGEMAPKSWAIAHPERSAMLLALPMRAFITVTRPLLLALNGLANMLLRRAGVEPVAEVGVGQSPDALRELVDHSAEVGTLDQARRRSLAAALAVNTRPVGDLVTPAEQICAVDIGASVRDAKQAAIDAGHLRLVVRDGERFAGVAHVRDTLTAEPDATVADLPRTGMPELPATMPIYQAINELRRTRTHFARVTGADASLLGIVTLQDLVDPLLAGQDTVVP